MESLLVMSDKTNKSVCNETILLDFFYLTQKILCFRVAVGTIVLFFCFVSMYNAEGHVLLSLYLFVQHVVNFTVILCQISKCMSLCLFYDILKSI